MTGASSFRCPIDFEKHMIVYDKDMLTQLVEEAVTEFPEYIRTVDDVSCCDWAPEFSAELYLLPLVYDKLKRVWPERHYDSSDAVKVCEDIRDAYSGNGLAPVPISTSFEGFALMLHNREWIVDSVSYDSKECLSVGYEDYEGVPWVDLAIGNGISPEAIVVLDDMLNVIDGYLPFIEKSLEFEEAWRKEKNGKEMKVDEAIGLVRKRLTDPLPDPYDCEQLPELPDIGRDGFLTEVVQCLVLAKGYGNMESGTKTKYHMIREEALNRGLAVNEIASGKADLSIGDFTVEICQHGNVVVNLRRRVPYLWMPLSFAASHLSAAGLLDFIEYIVGNVGHIQEAYDEMISDMKKRIYVCQIRKKSLPLQIRDTFRKAGLRKVRYRLFEDGILVEVNLHSDRKGGPWLSCRFGDHELETVAVNMKLIRDNPKRISEFPGYRIKRTSQLWK